MKLFLMMLIISIVTLVAGVFLGSKYIGKGEVVTTLCVLGEVAVQQKYLSQEQFLSLTENTGQQLKKKYSLLAENIALGDEAIKRASESSDCSQILVAFTRGIKKK